MLGILVAYYIVISRRCYYLFFFFMIIIITPARLVLAHFIVAVLYVVYDRYSSPPLFTPTVSIIVSDPRVVSPFRHRHNRRRRRRRRIATTVVCQRCTRNADSGGISLEIRDKFNAGARADLPTTMGRT